MASEAAELESHTLIYVRLLWIARRRFDPSSSPSASLLNSQPRSLAEPDNFSDDPLDDYASVIAEAPGTMLRYQA